MFENGSLLRRRKRFKLHKNDKHLLNEELTALANLNRFFFTARSGNSLSQLPPPDINNAVMGGESAIHLSHYATHISPAVTQHRPLSRGQSSTATQPRRISPISTENSHLAEITLFNLRTTNNFDIEGTSTYRPKRSFTIESLITPDKPEQVSEKDEDDDDRTDIDVVECGTTCSNILSLPRVSPAEPEMSLCSEDQRQQPLPPLHTITAAAHLPFLHYASGVNVNGISSGNLQSAGSTYDLAITHPLLMMSTPIGNIHNSYCNNFSIIPPPQTYRSPEVQNRIISGMRTI
ncbi:fd96Ca [Drosophila busckii]|uniref:Fd96Ca n=2 Tax=Drosophila busckii TaxID=30019 RepID=A0A0M3QYM2_DROBS|nr:fd96Ca [Drosophila busckii]